MKFYAESDRMIRFLRILSGIVPGHHPGAIDMRAGFMGTGEMNIKVDSCSYWWIGCSVEEDAAAADIEAARGKVDNLALDRGADHAGTPSLADAGEKAPSNFKETVAVEGFEENRVTTGEVTDILFAGFADHDDWSLAEGRVGLDLQAALRSRHAGDLLCEIDELRLFGAA